MISLQTLPFACLQICERNSEGPGQAHRNAEPTLIGALIFEITISEFTNKRSSALLINTDRRWNQLD